ncbi:MAG: calcium-binding protein [Paracoccaceae bacterium]
MSDGFVDTVVGYFDSGAGPIPGPYGWVGNWPGSISPVDPTTVVTGDNPGALSLPTGSWVHVRFEDEVIVDGDGDDLFIKEEGNGAEDAEVWILEGDVWKFIGIAEGDKVTAFDLADVGFKGFLTDVYIEGLDNGGAAPGFDVVSVEGLAAGLEPLDQDNEIVGTRFADTIKLLGGDDTFLGRGGDDRAWGGKGDDTMKGQGGDDVLRGQSGDDRVAGGGGDDRAIGNGGDDRVLGNGGDDVVKGGGGDDKVKGGGGDDKLNGGAGDDLLVGGGGADIFQFNTRAGDDVVRKFDLEDDLIELRLGKFDADDIEVTDVSRGALVELGKTSILFLGLDADELMEDANVLFL